MPRLDYDPSAIEDRGGGDFPVLPAGFYMAQITESDLLTPKSGRGQMLKLTFEIMDEGYRGRLLWANLNIKHESAEAQDIAARDLKRICEAVGHDGRLEDSESLHFKPMRIKVRVKNDATYGEGNEIKGYASLSGERPAGRREAPAQQQRREEPQKAAAGGGSRRPWER